MHPLRSALASPRQLERPWSGRWSMQTQPLAYARCLYSYTTSVLLTVTVNKTAMRDFFISPKVESRLGSKRRLEYVVSACDAGAELQTRIDVLLALPPTSTVRAAMGVRPCPS